MADIMTVRATDELQKLLNDKSKTFGLTRNALIVQILWGWLKENETARGGKAEESGKGTSGTGILY